MTTPSNVARENWRNDAGLGRVYADIDHATRNDAEYSQMDYVHAAIAFTETIVMFDIIH